MKARQQFRNIFGISLNKKKHLDMLELLIALENVLAFSYLGFIELPPISVTTLPVLVVVAAMLFGPWDAMAVAGVFAVTSVWKATVTSIEYGDIAFSPFASGKPFGSILMAVVSRLLFAVIAGYLFRWFFSKERKQIALGISAISVISVLLHNLFVYIPMVTFFGAAQVETSESFDKALILNNIILLAVTVAAALAVRRLINLPGIYSFFSMTSEERLESKDRSTAIRIIYLGVLISTVFVAVHLRTRLDTYMVSARELPDTAYMKWVDALVLQFVVGLAGICGMVSIFFRWIQEYYAARMVDANIRARESAEAANRTKSAFLFNMSHDIRTPMNAILGYTDIALKHTDDIAKVEDSLNKIKASGGHLLNLINDILEMSRIEAGRLEINEEPVDFIKAVENVTYMGNALASPKEIDFEVHISDIPDKYVYADELHANEVLINLISNAVKYTERGGRIDYYVEQISAPVDGKARYRFRVKDNGIGMSEEFQEHIFEAFSREGKMEVSKQEGAGLGLSIVRNIVDLAGGTITVESKLREGSCFTVEVPLRVMSDEEIADFIKQDEQPETVAVRSLEGKRVLLVEDNEMNREIAGEILKEYGMTVDTAENGQIAVITVSGKHHEYYDFILMDIQMPIMDGYSATAAIRKLPYGDRIPIIALSANAFKEDVEKSLAAGMNAHVAKPIDVQVLLDTMRSLMK